MIVALKTGGFEAVGDFLIFDDSEGGIGTRISTLLQFLEPVANVVESGPFLRSAPGSDQAKSGDTVRLSFLSGSENRLRFDETVTRRIGLIGSRLGAESAIFGTASGFDVYYRTKVHFVSLEMFANAIGPTQQIVNVGSIGELEQPKPL